MSIQNRYRVPKRQWRNWSEGARHVFNGIFKVMRDQGLFLHSDVLPMSAKQWKVTRWNAAWMAASHHDEVRGHGGSSSRAGGR
jgi:hypothetical protein